MLVSVLVVFIALAVLQLALTLHVRNMLMSSASEGARFAALADRAPHDGEQRALSVVGAALPGYAVSATARETDVDGAPAVSVVLTAPVPLVGVWGAGSMTVEGRAYQEESRG